MDYITILSGALVDYTEWVLRQQGKPVCAPAELTGILYNKLIGRLREVYSASDLRESVKVSDLAVMYARSGLIERLEFLQTSSIYHANRGPMLEGLNKALSQIDVRDYQSKLGYELGKIILETKKSLNHGSQ